MLATYAHLMIADKVLNQFRQDSSTKQSLRAIILRVETVPLVRFVVLKRTSRWTHIHQKGGGHGHKENG
jgi:hypothetical protein